MLSNGFTCSIRDLRKLNTPQKESTEYLHSYVDQTLGQTLLIIALRHLLIIQLFRQISS